MDRKLLFLMVLLVVFLNPVSAIDFSVTPSETSFTLGWGETADSSVDITNQNSLYSMNCDIIKNGEIVTTVDNIGAGQTKSGSYSLTAPDSGSSTVSRGMSVYCKDGYGAEKTKDYTVFVSYPVEGQEDAHSLIEEAENQVNSASSEITEAENKLSEAERIGASTTEAQRSIDSANSDLEDANDYFSRANNAYDNDNFQSAQNYAINAQNRADSAVSDANDAINEAETAIQQRKDEARSKITDAESEVESLRSNINALESKIEAARSSGLTVEDEEQKLENYRRSLNEAESSLEEARTSSSNNNYGEALNNAQEVLEEASSAVDNVKSTVNSLEESIPDAGESSVPTEAKMTVKNLVSGDQEVSRQKSELKSNSFQREDMTVTPSTGPRYSVEMIYTHSSGETLTLSSTVNTAEEMVNDVSLSGNPSQINQRWEDSQSTQQTRNSILMFAGAAILLIISGAFAYYFVNPVNKTVNNFVGGEDGDESSSGSKFDCPSCGAPVTPDSLEEGECPYCGATVSP